MERIPQSQTIRVPMWAYLSSDHVSPAIGATIVIQISQNGSAFANPDAGPTNATEIGNGAYYVDLDGIDTGTQGPLIVLGTASGVDPVTVPPYNVVDAETAGFDNAAALLKYDMSTVTGEADRSPLNCLRTMRNKWQVILGVITFTKEDDTSTAWQTNVSTTPGANPITGSTPI